MYFSTMQCITITGLNYYPLLHGGRKEGVKQWLLAKNAPFPDDHLKKELLQAMWSVRNEYISCVVDKMTEQKV